MADLAAYARHCGTKAARLPQVPEAFDDLKAILVHIASGRVPSLARALMRLEEVIRDG